MAVKLIDIKYRDIFENLNLEIKQNQITTVVGKNGSGKTSLLSLIFGLDLEFDGKIIIDRKSIDHKTNSRELEIIRRNIFYLSQEYHNQLFNVNIFEDIKYGVSNLDTDKLDELLKIFNLNKEILNRTYFELSDGELKKILIISMFIRDSKIFLLDDPTTALDQKSVSTLIKLLKKEKRNGKIIIVTSQDSEFVFSISDNIVMLDNKKLITKDNKYEFFENQELLNKCGLTMPNVLEFRENVLKRKGIKLVYRDNINDLIKDIYRNAK